MSERWDPVIQDGPSDGDPEQSVPKEKARENEEQEGDANRF